jgi:dTDP-4-amino-4,6-dideoxygalactose transaminase
MDRVFWVGVFPGITEAMVEYVVEAFRELAGARTRR